MLRGERVAGLPPRLVLPNPPCLGLALSPGQEAMLSARDGGGRVTRGKGQGIRPEGWTRGEYVLEQIDWTHAQGGQVGAGDGKGEAWVPGGSSHDGPTVEVQVGSALDPAPAFPLTDVPAQSCSGRPVAGSTAPAAILSSECPRALGLEETHLLLQRSRDPGQLHVFKRLQETLQFVVGGPI